MYNQVGLGVLGTFGEPHGYQQVFYFNVSFNESLDLDDNAIEFYPGSDLFAVRRELVNGVSSICFCIYSYARELNTERFGTFIGTCIVLQDGYAEADYIYKTLRSLHNAVLRNPDNVDNSTIKVAQARDIIVQEPGELPALKANVIPIGKTPFSSTFVDPGKKYLVTPNPLNEDNEETQVTAFFDTAQKLYTDTGSMFFTFDRNVYEFVAKAGLITATDWDEFLEHSQPLLPPTVVRTKKGIQKNTSATEPPSAPAAPAAAHPHTNDQREADYESHQAYMPATDTDDEDDDSYDSDPYKPFDLWEGDMTETAWTADEVRIRVKEYNRLFKYTNTLLEHINDTGGRKGKKKRMLSEATPDDAGSKSGKRKRAVLLLLGLIIVGSILVYFFAPDNTGTQTATAQSAESVQEDDSTDIVTDSTLAIDDTVYETVSATPSPKQDTDVVPPVQPIAKAPIGPPAYVPDPAPKPAATPPAEAIGVVNEATSMPARNMLLLRQPSVYLNAKPLHPTPNIEMTQSDVSVLKEVGVKNKSLTELTQVLFDYVPSNIGNIYRGQELEYAAALLAANKLAFQHSGTDYICTSDFTTLHIPAYKSPRLPAVSPK